MTRYVLMAFVFSQSVLSDDVLPTITVYSSDNPDQLEQIINSPQLLDEADVSIAHERSMTDVLQGYSGFSSSKNGGFGQIGTIFLRGAGGQGLVTLDDIPLIMSIPGFFNLDTLPPEAIQNAEIERGPSSAYYSFQSLGGAIRLYSQERRDSGATLSVEGGSFGTLRETLQGGLSGNLGRITATLSRADVFDGVHLANADTNPEREPSHFTQGLLRFSSILTPKLQWQGSLLYRNSGSGSDRFGIDQQRRISLQDDANSGAKEETWLTQSSLDYQVASDWNSRLQLGYTQLSTDLNAGPLLNGVFTRLYLANWRNRNTIVDDPKQRKQWQLIWGGQGRQEQGASRTSSFAQERTMASGFIDTQFQYGNFSGEAGVRVEHFDRFGDQPLFKASMAWRLLPELTLRASGGTGYRLPSFTELLFLFSGNPNLKPERSASGNLGIEWHPVTAMQIAVNGYYFRYDDLITPVYDPVRGFIALNIPNAVVTGMDADIRYDWSDGFETGLSYTFSDNRDLNTDEALPLRPDHTARVWGQKKLAMLPVTLWVETVIRSSTWNDTANSVPIDGSVLVNAAIRYAVSNQAEIYLRGENLTDNRTPQIYSADMPGIAVYGGFRLNF